MKLGFSVYTKVLKPAKQVYNAVYNPKKLMKYFTTKNASGPLKGGTTVMWDFADFPGAFPVDVVKSVPNKRIVLRWPSVSGGKNRVEMKFQNLGKKGTKVTISESGWADTPKGRKHSYMNCWGWAQMLSCLKAYAEHGINLRKGAY
jgi:uncharacterized protein YndB with AHSA1/START domain